MTNSRFEEQMPLVHVAAQMIGERKSVRAFAPTDLKEDEK